MDKVKKIYELIDLLESESDDETKKLHEKISKIKEKWDKIHKKLIKEKNKKIKQIKQKALDKIKELDDPFELKRVKGDAEDIIDRIVEDYKEKTKKSMVMRDKEIDVAILEKRLKRSALAGAAAFGTAYGGYKYYTYLQKRKEAEKQLGENFMPKLYEEYLTNLNEAMPNKFITTAGREAAAMAKQRATNLAANAVNKRGAFEALSAKIRDLQAKGLPVPPEMAKQLATLRAANIQANAAKVAATRGM